MDLTGAQLGEAAHVRDSLAELLAQRGAMIIQMYVAGMTLQQVGDFWGLSLGTVRRRVLAEERRTGCSLLRPVGSYDRTRAAARSKAAVEPLE